MPAAFLVQQIELREALDDAKTSEDIDEISLQANENERKQLLEVERLLDQQHDYPAAAQAVRALMFLARLGQDIDARAELLGQ
jgi:molecular chaperone HscB